MNGVSRETLDRLELYESLVKEENSRQNLISASSINEFKVRHVADARQLAALGRRGNWCDIGSGAGLPGVVIAIVTGAPVTLIEPRRLRADFLRRIVRELGVNAEIREAKAERVSGCYDNVTARAVADLSSLFAMTEHLARPQTRWIFPKGRSAKKELAVANQAWQGSFTLVASQTSDDAMIVVAENVKRRVGR